MPAAKHAFQPQGEAQGGGKHASLSPDQRELIALGEALYGAFWVAPLAAEMGLATPTLWIVQSGAKPVPASWWARLPPIVERRVTLLAQLRKRWPEHASRKHAFLTEVGETLGGRKWKVVVAPLLVEHLPSLSLSHSRNVPTDARGMQSAPAHRTLGRMALGDQPIPAELWPALLRVVRHRESMLRDLGRQLARRL